VELSWNGGATWTAAKTTSALGTAQARYVLGGVADRWGRTWAVSGLSDANFRVRVVDVGRNALQGFELDWVGVLVHYAPP
jgi:hypothetical protein